MRNRSTYLRQSLIASSRKRSRSYLISILALTLMFTISVTALETAVQLVPQTERLKGAAEISVFFTSDLNPHSLKALTEELSAVDGVRSVHLVDADTAYREMVQALGEQASILELYDDNPFEPYFRVELQLEVHREVAQTVEALEHVTYVQDNKEVLTVLGDGIKTLLTVLIAVLIVLFTATFVIVFYLVRELVVTHLKEIETLKWLGASDSFIAAPYVIQSEMLVAVSFALALLLHGLLKRGIQVPFLGVFEGATVQMGVPYALLYLFVAAFAASVTYGAYAKTSKQL